MTYSAATIALTTFTATENRQQVTFHNLNNGEFFTFEPSDKNALIKISANQAMNKKGEVVVFKPKSSSIVYKFK